jgi:hypothetical protein
MKVLDKISEIVSYKREVHQMGIVMEGWGWLYADGDVMFIDTIREHIELLCHAFDVSLADDAKFELYHYETAESYYFEGKKRNLQMLSDYLIGKYEGQELWIDKQLDKLWQEYKTNYRQYDWIEQLNDTIEGENYDCTNSSL